MSRPILPSTSPGTTLTAKIRVLGREFAFPLLTRPLDLGPAGTIEYYWLDSRPLRGTAKPADPGPVRLLVDHWWTSMRSRCWAGELDQQIHYVLARCHEVFLQDKGPQAVYRDAYLRQGRADDLPTALDDEARERIRQVADSRDRAAVATELDGTLGRVGPPGHELPAFQRAFEHWVGRGVVAFRRGGADGLDAFLGEIAEWSARYRRKGGQDRVRLFLNMFAYEAKVSFYTCYANAWVDLIPWIAKHRGLDTLGERFLRLWHHQNGPVEIPAERIPRFLYLPTCGGRAIFTPTESRDWVLNSFAWRTPSPAPEYLPDVFSGQVLALHPLSGFFMNGPGLLAVAGRFLGCDAYDRVMGTGRAADCPEYWDLVAAILHAAGLYRLAAEEQAATRGIRCRILVDGERDALCADGRVVRPRTRRQSDHSDR